MDYDSADLIRRFIDQLEAPFIGGSNTTRGETDIVGAGSLPSAFATTELATASMAAAGRAAAHVAALIGNTVGAAAESQIEIDRRLASSWFGWTLDPIGWTPTSPWDDLAGIYRSSDGWIRLHTNAPHHRQAALHVLGLGGGEPSRDLVTEKVTAWIGDDLENKIVEANGCAAVLRSEAEWLAHPQGAAVANEPVAHVSWTAPTVKPSGATRQSPSRPLAGVKVLDLTRVLAGPIATRFLAGLGADVLRLDPPDWDEPGVIPEVTLGKRCGRIDLGTDDGRQRLTELLSQADIVVHGYRGDALQRLGLGDDVRRDLAPGLIDVSLNAYGWTGPWRFRRGFDSLVQMSCGIAHTGGVVVGGTTPEDDQFQPHPLPVQALDHATGYLLATAALHGWARRLIDGSAMLAKMSLARTAHVLLGGPRTDPETTLADVTDADWESAVEETSWGPARRLRPPLHIEGVELHWDRPATKLGSETNLAW